MTGIEFKEVLETVCMTTGASKEKIAEYLFVSNETMRIWKRDGLTRKRTLRVMKKLKEFLHEEM